MNTILNEQILRIKQVMGICETKEEDKKIIDNWFEYVKNTSHEDAVNQMYNGGKYLKLRQESIDAGERIFVYEKIEEAKSIDELINLFTRDFKFIDYVRKHFWGTGNQRYLEMKQALCLLNGGSENQCYDLDLRSDLLPYDKPINWDKVNKIVDEIPGLKERVYRLKRIASANKITSNFETNQPNIKKNEPTSGPDQYISKLNYSDVGFNTAEPSESMKKYAEALSKENPNEIESLVNNLVDRFKNLMTTKVNKEISAAGMSKSWAYWDIGKQLYFYNNPEESNYRLGNPLTDKWIQQSIINRMIGWEVTNGGKKQNGDKYSSEELTNIGETYL
jgi:hypothetical protein